ncbi:MAG: DMT family transporter [Hydrogenophaga sp.]|uniref:DMT family transporter n=1 Tax=Hydrogenophaga sp. TaxID=1904254 RepID=UPI0025B84B52|nr:DMT family transporter [Hydrogenophaga sp.]MDO9504791.1 DMT family transporter [Hydrogenophaga sp.]MDP2075312.1 DMT family transporter [Hydrogenophaga sp.]MDP2987070.1 DMT family transporter [Hydrogenophaga sp.]MDP3109586.1 DMT family transporter [Hydrogenophaga sp.]MDP3204444.1 DMT family transporter [Hydrogenophaga sp.]
MPEPARRTPAHALLGIAFLIAATACFAVLDTTVKYVGAFVSVLVAVWFRYVFHAVAVSAIMLPLRGRRLWQTAHPRYQVLRGCLLLMVSIMSFVSVQFMPVGEFTAIIMISPLAVTLLAALFLKEDVSVLRWALVAGGFAGALLVVQPGREVIGWASLLPLVMVFTYAWFQILTSKMARTEDPMTMHFYTGWVGALMASLALPFVWQVIPDARTFALLCLIGLMGTVGHFLLILAFARAPASTLTPYLYTQIGFAMLCGWAVFGHAPGPLELAGIGMIVLCGATASWLTARDRRLPVEQPEA